MKKVIAWILTAALFISMVPVQHLQASDVQKIAVEDKADMKELLQYLLINQPEQQVGEEQMVVISLGEGAEQVENLELAIRAEDGNTYIMQPVKGEDGVYVFQKTFAKGVYYVESVSVVSENKKEMILLEDFGIQACFSVGTECPEEEKSEHIEVESIETPVVTIDEDNVENAQESIVEALTEVEVPAVFNNARTVNKNVVVVLDPGHDSQHQGASYFGLKEHILNFKIASYCKEELENYGGITVYMTRESEACPHPGSKDNIDDIVKRVKAAHQKGADAYISIHLNASTSASVKGAEVYYHSSSKEGEKISQKVQDELVALGLYDREIKTNNNYAVTKTAQSLGFPGIIIEHAFMSNQTEFNKYLKTEAGLKKLGIADATGIANYFGLSKFGTKVSVEEAVYTVANAGVTDQVLGISGEAPGLEVPELLATQRFELVSLGNKYYQMKPEGSDKVLGVTDGELKLEEANVMNADQNWAFLYTESEGFLMKTESGKYLAVTETGIAVESEQNEATQKWTLEKASYRPIEGLTPALVSVENGDEMVNVQWKALTGAEGYYIYRKTEGTGWEKIGTVSSETSTWYKDTKAPANTYCIYTVAAYKGDTVSLYDENGMGVKTPVKKTYIKYKTTTSVNYRTGAGTSYAKAGQLAKGTVISVEQGYSKAANGYTWYRFKLNGKNYYIATKYIQKVVSLEKPKLVSAKYSNGTVTVKWKKISNAKGYYVYRKLSGGSWSKIATVKSAGTVQYKDTKAKAGKKYVYTVRAYNGSELSGYYSGVSVSVPKETLVKYKTTSKVKYRSGAGTSYSAKGTLAKGKTVSVVKGWSKTANGMKWYKIKMSGKYYYIAAKYLKKI